MRLFALDFISQPHKYEDSNLKGSLRYFSTYTRAKTVLIWTADIFVIKRTAMQLLAEFIGRQKIRLVEGRSFKTKGKR
jgi:hypothetical protein